MLSVRLQCQLFVTATTHQFTVATMDLISVSSDSQPDPVPANRRDDATDFILTVDCDYVYMVGAWSMEIHVDDCWRVENLKHWVRSQKDIPLDLQQFVLISEGVYTRLNDDQWRG